MDKLCAECNNLFSPARSNQTLCGKVCTKTRRERKYREHNPLPEDPDAARLSTSTTGAMNELIACADLMRKGYEIFRAVSPASRFDLAAFKDGKLMRIEVTTGHKGITGKISRTTKDFSRFDILITVLQDGSLIYEPELPE